MTKLSVVLAILTFILIYILRWEQGGWEIEIDLFKDYRQALDRRISGLLPSPQAELLSGILLGQNKDLPPQTRLALRDTSTLHIVVASGQNLSMVAGFFLGLSGLLKRKTAIFLSLVSVVFYAILTGFQIPVLRAAIMFGFASLAQLFGRQKDSIWVLIITAGGMLWINPRWILDLSFQLSFAATIGVVVVAPILLRYFKYIPILSQDLAVSLGAQILVTPIIAQNFHQFSLVGLITNLLILWTISFIMILGTIMLLLSFISAVLTQFVTLGVSALLTYFIYIVSFFSILPFAWEYVGEKVWIFWVGYYFILAGVVLFMLSLSNDKKANFDRP